MYIHKDTYKADTSQQIVAMQQTYARLGGVTEEFSLNELCEDAIRINAALKDSGVIPDFRYPNVIRLAPVALYTSYREVFQVVDIIEDIMVNRKYDNYEGQRGLVA